MKVSDEIIWNKIKKGDKESLAQIFICHYDDLFRYAKRLEKNEELIKDLIQDLFANIWNKKTRLAHTNNIKFYLYKSLRNLIINNYNNKHNSIQKIDINENDFIFSQVDFSIEEEENTSKKEKLIHAINNLPPKQREVIYLKYFQGFDIEEIAMVLNQNNQSVRNNLHRALTKLRNTMFLEIFLTSILSSIN